MGYIAIDTETTGLPSKRTNDFKNLSVFNSCRIVSLAVIVYDDDDNELSFYESLVKPVGYRVTATEIHGITHERAELEGKDFLEIWETLNTIIPENSTIIGHNLDFDMNVIKSESFRAGYTEGCFKTAKQVCTLKMAKDVYKNMKSFKLGNLYKSLYGKDLVGWHGATADARACADIYKMMKSHVKPDYKDIPVKKIIIKASEVAACIGKNPFKKPQEISDEIWKKYLPETFTGTTKNDRARQYIAQSADAQNALQLAMSTKANQSTDTQSIVSVVEKSINSDVLLSTIQKREVNDYIRSQVFTTFGTKSEDKTSDKVVIDEGVILERDESFYTTEITNICGTKYVITGKIDRIEVKPDGTRVLVEIKNRTRCLFNSLRDYELVQVQTYLKLTGLTHARLIEQYNNEINSYNIEWDHNYWENTVKPNLETFCKNTHIQMSN